MERYALGLYEKSMPGTLSIPEKLLAAGDAGFDYVELSVDETDEKLARLSWGRKEIRELLDAQANSGVPIRSICLSGHRRFPLGHPDVAVQGRSLEIMGGAVALAARLGVRIIQLAGYDVYYEPSTDITRKYFEENLARSVEIAAREGVILAFETMETDFLNTTRKAMHWVDLFRSPYLQVYPDIGNVTNAMEGDVSRVDADLQDGAGHLAALHLKETVAGKYRDMQYGQGRVDFPAAAERALKLGVRMFVGEFWYAGEADWQATLERSNGFLRKAIAEGEARMDCPGRVGGAA